MGVYGLLWFAVAVVANAIGRHSATNAVALAAIWLALVVVVPSVVNVAATTLYPVPSRVQMMQAMREASDEASAQGSQLLAQYYEDHPEMAGGQADLDAFAIQSYAVQEDVTRRVQPVMARFDDPAVPPAAVREPVPISVSGAGGAGSAQRHFRDQRLPLPILSGPSGWLSPDLAGVLHEPGGAEGPVGD